MKLSSEATASMYVTARSGLVEHLNTNSLKHIENKSTLKGNQHVTGGKFGEHTNKSSGEAYEEKMSKHRVTGSVRCSEALKLVRDRDREITKSIARCPAKLASWNRLRSLIRDNDLQFEAKRVAVKMESYEQSQAKEKAPNALQRRTGIEVTPLIAGRILYSALLKNRDMENLKLELQFRGLSTEGGWKKDLIPSLKKSEGGDPKSFKPRSPHLSLETIYGF